MAIDPICGMTVDTTTALHAERDGKTFYFCSDHCRQDFLPTPAGPRDRVINTGEGLTIARSVCRVLGLQQGFTPLRSRPRWCSIGIGTRYDYGATDFSSTLSAGQPTASGKVANELRNMKQIHSLLNCTTRWTPIGERQTTSRLPDLSVEQCAAQVGVAFTNLFSLKTKTYLKCLTTFLLT